MTTLQLVIICVTVFALALVVVSARSIPDDGAANDVALGATVVVHTLDQRSIRGVVRARDVHKISLGEAVYLEDAQPHPLGGDIHIPARNIAMAQVLS